MKNNLSRNLRIINPQKCSSGFTLIELLVATAISGFVITGAGFGLVTIMGADEKAQAETTRRIELSRALDFIADEIRMARRINTATTNTTKAGDAVVASNAAILFSPALGIDITDSAIRGKISLYLEIPITTTITGNCPAGGPNAGLPPPQPSTYDRVVYDIRANTSIWLAPRVVNRYGRNPRNNGTINPCSNPVASKALVDSITDNNINDPAITCALPAVLSGTEGFYACVNGRQADLYLGGELLDAYGGSRDPYQVSTRVFARSVAPSP